MSERYNSTVDIEVDESTGCFNWQGSVSTDGYPVMYAGGQQVLLSRMFFSDRLADLPSWARIRRVCSSASCVLDNHHVLQAPLTVAKRLGYSHHDLRGLVELMRGRAAREPSYAEAWTTSNLRGLGVAREEVESWATRAAVPPLLVLAAHASLVGASERAHARSGSPGN